MFYEQRTEVRDLTPAQLRASYDGELAAVVESVGIETAATETAIDRETLRALVDGERPDISLSAAAAVQSLQEGAPEADAILEIACEHLLLGMTSGVIDVDTLAADVDLDLDAKEIQQKIERRAPMSFDEFVHLQHAIARNQP